LRADCTREMNPGFSKKLTEAILNDDNLPFSWCLAVGADFSDDIASQCLTLIVKRSGLQLEETLLHAICLRCTSSVQRKELINLNPYVANYLQTIFEVLLNFNNIS